MTEENKKEMAFQEARAHNEDSRQEIQISQLYDSVAKRTIKDCVFTDFFGRKENLIRLSRTLHPEDIAVSEEDLEEITIYNVLVDGLKLDLARESLVEVNTATLYEWAYFPEMETRLTPIRNVCVRNVKCREAGCVLKIDGDARLPVENIKVESIKVEKIHRADVVKCANNVTFDGKVMEGLHAEESVTVPGIVTLDTPVGHAEIALKGARVLGWSPTGDREMLRMRYKTYADEPGEWSHGGICPCWPWFGGKDVNGKKVIK